MFGSLRPCRGGVDVGVEAEVPQTRLHRFGTGQDGYRVELNVDRRDRHVVEQILVDEYRERQQRPVDVADRRSRPGPVVERHQHDRRDLGGEELDVLAHQVVGRVRFVRLLERDRPHLGRERHVAGRDVRRVELEVQRRVEVRAVEARHDRPVDRVQHLLDAPALDEQRAVDVHIGRATRTGVVRRDVHPNDGLAAGDDRHPGLEVLDPLGHLDRPDRHVREVLRQFCGDVRRVARRRDRDVRRTRRHDCRRDRGRGRRDDDHRRGRRGARRRGLDHDHR